ncbi:MAG: endopeptidase La, partial [Deferribacterales bacterium]|nr:endopeptidase La [Deferribacterales bacterium]
VENIIQGYTRESGLRKLEQMVGKVCRKVGRLLVEEKGSFFRITPGAVTKYLGPAAFQDEDELKTNSIGVVTGLAWTPVGGEVLFVECTRFSGKGALILTGMLGDVMKESSQAALTFIKTVAEKYGANPEDFQKYDFHVHVPSGAIPKDGPSAGITMATAILSVITGKPVRKDVAMTGEITITGKVLPIGGLKEKLLAAKRIGVKTVIIPKKNESDLIKLPKYVKSALKIIPVEHYEEVANIAVMFGGE